VERLLVYSTGSISIKKKNNNKKYVNGDDLD
jgi:hypothetical protein